MERVCESFHPPLLRRLFSVRAFNPVCRMRALLVTDGVRAFTTCAVWTHELLTRPWLMPYLSSVVLHWELMYSHWHAFQDSLWSASAGALNLPCCVDYSCGLSTQFADCVRYLQLMACVPSQRVLYGRMNFSLVLG